LRIVIKVGTSTLISADGSLNKKYILELSGYIAELQNLKHEILIVSSGAIAAGLWHSKLNVNPANLSVKQAFSAVGQPLIMNAYAESFVKYGKPVAQILLTRDDFDKRLNYINLRNTLNVLIKRGIIPIINENDSVAVDEIKFGDNDTLAALLSAAVNADKLIIFTDVDGFYNGQPSKARLISKIEKITEEIESFAGSNSSSGKGTGGMKTKIAAAKIAVASGVETIITNGAKPDLLKKIILGQQAGTVVKAVNCNLKDKKKWIAFSKKPKGSIFVDAEAGKILIEKGKSLLSAGVVKISGDFKRGDTVNIFVVNSSKNFARGLINYDSVILDKIKGKKTSEIKKILSESGDEIINRDNLVVL
jgi:glutamate 5-kinase